MKNTVKALIVAGVMLGVAALAAAAPPHHGKPKHGGPKFGGPKFGKPHQGGLHHGGHHHGGLLHHFKPFFRPTRTIRYYPRTRYYTPRRVIYPLTTPTVTYVRRTVVVTPPPDPADEIRAQLAALKTEYYKLSKARQSLLNWLAGPGQSASAIDRMKVETRVAMIERDCTRIAGQMAELELKLAML